MFWILTITWLIRSTRYCASWTSASVGSDDQNSDGIPRATTMKLIMLALFVSVHVLVTIDTIRCFLMIVITHWWHSSRIVSSRWPDSYWQLGTRKCSASSVTNAMKNGDSTSRNGSAHVHQNRANASSNSAWMNGLGTAPAFDGEPEPPSESSDTTVDVATASFGCAR